MHLQEVFNAIYNNHLYEYFVIDKSHKVIEYSDKVFSLCVNGPKDCTHMVLEKIVPELYGLEDEIEKIFKGEKSVFTLPYIFKEPDIFVHIHIHPGRENKKWHAGEYRYESLIILFENITSMAVAQQSLIQERNEKALLLKEISQKNRLLKQFNEQMQELVDEEVSKNMEKQRIIELQSRHSQMGEIISMIIHQWKQPLNAMSIIVNVLKLNLKKKTLSSESIEAKLDDILTQVKFMDQTVRDFQNFFNPSREKIPFNLYDTIVTVIDLVGYDYEHKDITLTVEGDKSVTAYGYPNEFSQIILTLLQNARDAFMENPTEEMKVTITIEKDGTQGVVRVTDNAGGIPESVIGTIFDLYMTTKEEGYGLGLNIAKHMLEKNMNGKLTVKNVAHGAEFRICL
jgi:signal transduction histidine kinase